MTICKDAGVNLLAILTHMHQYLMLLKPMYTLLCSFDNAEVYAGGKAEEVMGQAIKVTVSVFCIIWQCPIQCA